MSCSPRKIFPESAFSRPAISRSSVVFPHPLGPSKAKNLPEGIDRLTSGMIVPSLTAFFNFSSLMLRILLACQGWTLVIARESLLGSHCSGVIARESLLGSHCSGVIARDRFRVYLARGLINFQMVAFSSLPFRN